MAVRMATLEAEKQRVLQEVENARHRDREAVEEVKCFNRPEDCERLRASKVEGFTAV